MRVMGIDPSIRVTGYGIIDFVDGKTLLVDFGTIKPPTDADTATRLAILYDDITELIKTHQPDELAIEEVFYGVNAKSVLMLGQARGAAMLCAAHHHLPVGEYAARKVKLAATGSGRASKEQVQFMVQRQLQMSEPPQPHDAADALAVALCHHRQLRLAGVGQ